MLFELFLRSCRRRWHDGELDTGDGDEQPIRQTCWSCLVINYQATPEPRPSFQIDHDDDSDSDSRQKVSH